MPKLRSELERAIQDVGRPMRWDSAEQVARKFVRDTFTRWEAFEKELFDLLRPMAEETDVATGSIPTFGTLVRNERAEAKDFDPGDVGSLLAELSRYIGPERVQRMRNLFESLAPDYIDTPDPMANSAAIFNQNYPRVIEDGWNEAGDRLEANARAQGELDRLQTATAGQFLDMSGQFARDVYERGFQYVRSKITIAALGEATNTIVSGLNSGLNWNNIAQNLHKRIGTGYLYHWQRLVRTEMTFAYYSTFMHRYTTAGAQYVKLSTSIGACPVCVGLQGYYTLGSEPRIPGDTHPNCRCVYLPFYRLPNGVEVVR